MIMRQNWIPVFAKRSALVLALVCLVAASGARAAGQATQAASGALIIPMQSTYQDACGIVSAYGLVYQMLAAEESIKAQKGRYITIHWAINPNKASPNRCVPTNLHANPSTPTACKTAGPPWTSASCNGIVPYLDNNNTPNWNDGCDFTVTSNASVPVTMVDLSGPTKPDLATFNSIDTTVNPGKTLSYPNYKQVTIQQAPASSPSPKTDVTAVQYLGGAFIIEAQDAQIFLDVLRGALSTTDATSAHNALSFTQFTAKTTCKTAVVGSSGTNARVEFTQAMPNPNTNTYANEHYVAIHRAKAPFTAYYGKDMSNTPGKIALLVTAGGQAGYGGAANGIKSDMLPAYLASAGLGTFTGAHGCPAGGYNALHATANCPNGGGSGVIYDAFDVFDLQDSAPDGTSAGPLSNQDSTTGARVYQNLWIPHWEGTTFSVSGRNCNNTCINTARATIKGFVSNQPVGVLAECGSIGVIEGTADTGQNPGGGWWYPDPNAGYPDPVGGYPSATFASSPGQLAEQVATCAQDTVDPTKCSSTINPVRGLQHEMDPNGDIIDALPLRNCTDPDLTSNNNCVYYSHPGDPYSQVGDQLWYPRSGLLSNYAPQTGALYNSSWTPLAFAIARVNQNPSGTGALPTPDQYRQQSVADLYSNTISPLSSSDFASSIVYLGGHTYASDVSGTRVVLNTMLAIGARTNPLETAIASPTAYNGLVYVPSYFAVPPNQNIPAEESNFTPSLGSLFKFPFHKGDVQGHGLFGTGPDALTSGANSFDVGPGGASAQSALPSSSPAVSFSTINARNIFTYLGGVIGSVSGVVGGAQTGWTPVDFDYSSVLTGSSCLDVFRIGEINSSTKTAFSGNSYAGMLKGKDGACDLQEALALTKVSLGLDHGTIEGVTGGPIPNAFNAAAEVANAEQLVQIVRGYCYATTTKVDGTGTFVPRPNYCNLGHNLNKKSLPVLGAFVHSQPAIIPASPTVGDLPAGKHRPTVMYVGGFDGMLHAFYVPSDGLDSGYTGPSNTTLHYPATSAQTVFHTTYSGAFSPPAKALTELWAFIPPGQLPLLKTNSAKVDGSPAVIDVFADFTNTGTREWHTVLVETAGGNNRELFALDVTNPLQPVLLWDLQPNFESAAPTSLQYAPVWLADDNTGQDTGLAEAFVWQNNCRSSSGCTPATFTLPPGADPGRSTSGLFNYSHLGASEGVSAAVLWRNNAPFFAAYVATNEPQDQSNSGQGIYTFALDASNGRKIWEFNNPYTSPSDSTRANQAAGLGNTPPAGVTLFSKANNNLIDTAYVGDDEGSLWELDAADGLNTTAYANSIPGCTGAQCNYALSQAYGTGAKLAQPISTLSSIFIVPPNYPIAGPLNGYQGQALLTYGTAGTDAISALEPSDCTKAPCITGNVHLLPISPTGRYQPADLKSNSTLRTTVLTVGIGKEVTGYPLQLPVGERLFGSIVAAGSTLFFATNDASQGSNIDNFQSATGGSYQFDLRAPLTGAPSPFVGLPNMNIGGAGSTPLVVNNPDPTKPGQLITVTNNGIAVAPLPGVSVLAGPPVNGQGQTPATFLGWFFRRRGSEY